MYIVMSKVAKMPRSCWGTYRRVAVVEIEDADGLMQPAAPSMISERARGVKRIVATWERLHVGKRSGAYWTALDEAERLCDKLNAETRS